MAETVKSVVLYDLIRYTDANGDQREASKGDEVELPKDEFDRLSDTETHAPNGAVAKAGSKQAKDAAADDAEAEPAG